MSTSGAATRCITPAFHQRSLIFYQKSPNSLLKKLKETGAITGMNQVPHEVDEWGSNALHYAAEGGHEETSLMLLQSGFDVQVQDRSGHSALMLAAQVCVCV